MSKGLTLLECLGGDQNYLKAGAGNACAGQSRVNGRPAVRFELVESEANRGALLLVGSVSTVG